MNTLSKKAALALSALTFLVIGSLIVFAPELLFSSNGITLNPSAAMMSEVRSPGVLILLACFAASMGLFYRRGRQSDCWCPPPCCLAMAQAGLSAWPSTACPCTTCRRCRSGVGTWLLVCRSTACQQGKSPIARIKRKPVRVETLHRLSFRPPRRGWMSGGPKPSGLLRRDRRF